MYSLACQAQSQLSFTTALMPCQNQGGVPPAKWSTQSFPRTFIPYSNSTNTQYVSVDLCAGFQLCPGNPDAVMVSSWLDVQIRWCNADGNNCKDPITTRQLANFNTPSPTGCHFTMMVESDSFTVNYSMGYTHDWDVAYNYVICKKVICSNTFTTENLFTPWKPQNQQKYSDYIYNGTPLTGTIALNQITTDGAACWNLSVAAISVTNLMTGDVKLETDFSWVQLNSNFQYSVDLSCSNCTYDPPILVIIDVLVQSKADLTLTRKFNQNFYQARLTKNNVPSYDATATLIDFRNPQRYTSNYDSLNTSSTGINLGSSNLRYCCVTITEKSIVQKLGDNYNHVADTFNYSACKMGFPLYIYSYQQVIYRADDYCRKVSGVYNVKLDVYLQGKRMLTEDVEITVQNNCNDETVVMTNEAGWLKVNGQNYVANQVIPYSSTVIEYDLTKLTLNQRECLKMSKDSRLKLVLTSSYYGANKQVIFQLDTSQASYSGQPHLTNQSYELTQLLNKDSSFTFDTETLVTTDYLVQFDTVDPGLKGWQKSISRELNVFKISVLDTQAENLAIINKTPDRPFTIKASEHFMTNMDNNTSLSGFQKANLSFTMQCTGPTVGSDILTAASSQCCENLFTMVNGVLTKQKQVNLIQLTLLSVNHQLMCDGLYTVTLTAKHPNFSNYSVTKSFEIRAKYDCQYLIDQKVYAVPLQPQLALFPGGDVTKQQLLNILAFKIGDQTLDVVHDIVQTEFYDFSCPVQYEFICPTAQTSCTYFDQVFERGLLNTAVRAVKMRRTQLRVKQTTNHLAMEFNGSVIQVNAYIFNSEDIQINFSTLSTTGDTPHYTGNKNFLQKMFWTNTIQVTKNCKPTVIKVQELANDPAAEVSSTLSATLVVNQMPLTRRTKNIIKFDVVDSWDKKNCLADLYYEFRVRDVSPFLMDINFQGIFEFTQPQTTSDNPKISLIAAANSVVNTFHCNLSTQNQLQQTPAPTTITYTNACDFMIEVEARVHIGPQGSNYYSVVGTYTKFKISVQNECYAIDVSQPPTTYNLWSPSPTQTIPFTYEIWHGAQPMLYSLPKLVPKLPSELLSSEYPSASQECGSHFDYSLLSPPVFAKIPVTRTADFPVVQILSTNSSDSGQTSADEYKRLHHLSLSAVYSSFSDGPKFVYDATKQATDRALDFYMQDRCIGMQFAMPTITSNTTDSAGNKRLVKTTLTEKNFVELYGQQADYFQMERITPYLYTSIDEAPIKANGKCGTIQYQPKLNAKFPDLATWDPAQINPDPRTPSTSDLQFKLRATTSMGVGDYSFEVCAGSAQSPLYALGCFVIPIRVYPCFVLSVSQSNTRQDFALKSKGPPVEIKIAPILQEPNCGYQWVYTLTTLLLKDMDDSIDFDALVLQSPKVEGTSPAALAVLNQETVTFSSSSQDSEGLTYATFVTARLNASSIQAKIKKNFEIARFKVEQPTKTIPKNTPPVIKSLVDYFNVQPGQKSQLQVGQLSDYESPKNVTLSSVQIHCEDVSSDWISPPPLGEVLTQLQIGVDVPQGLKDNTCSVQLTATDNDTLKPMLLTQKVIITVQTPKNEIEVEKASTQPKTEEQIQEQKQVDDLLSRLYPQSKQSNKFINIPLILEPKQVTSSGVLTLAFNRPVQLNVDYFVAHYKKRQLGQLSDTEQAQVNEILKNAFMVEYRPRTAELQPILLDYSVLEFRKAQEIDIQLTFNDPLQVSFYAELNDQLSNDTLLLSLKDAQVFIDPNTNTPITPALLQKEAITVPKQEATQQNSVTQLTQVTTEAMVKVLVPSTLVVNILLGVSLKKLWSAVNLLQFVTYVNLWRVSLPSNLENFIQKASFFARGDWIPKEHIMGLLHVKPKSTEDKQALQTRFLIILLVGLSIITIAVMGLIFACKSCSARIVRLCQQIKQQIFWNAIIRYSLQSYLDFAITASLAVAIRTSTSKPKLGIYSCLLLLLAVAPAGYFLLLRKKFPQLKSQELRLKIGTLYQSINVKSFSAVCYNVAFLVRRLIFAVITAFAGRFDGGLTVALIVTELVFFSVYLVTIKPQETQAGNRIELASEILLTHFFFGMMVCMCTDEPKQQYFVAWLSVAAIAILVMLCVGFLASDSVVKLIQWIKKKLAIQRRLAELERCKQEALAKQQTVEASENQNAQELPLKIKTPSLSSMRFPRLRSRKNPNDFFKGSSVPGPYLNQVLQKQLSSIQEISDDKSQSVWQSHLCSSSGSQSIQEIEDEESKVPAKTRDHQDASQEAIDQVFEKHSRNRMQQPTNIERQLQRDYAYQRDVKVNSQAGHVNLLQTPLVLQILPPEVLKAKAISSQFAILQPQQVVEEDQDEIFVSSYGNECLPEELQYPAEDVQPQLKDKFSMKELCVEDSVTKSLERRFFATYNYKENEVSRFNEKQNRFKGNTTNKN